MLNYLKTLFCDFIEAEKKVLILMFSVLFFIIIGGIFHLDYKWFGFKSSIVSTVK